MLLACFGMFGELLSLFANSGHCGVMNVLALLKNSWRQWNQTTQENRDWNISSKRFAINSWPCQKKNHLGAAWQARHLFHFVAMFFLSETKMPTLSGGFPWFPWPGHLGSWGKFKCKAQTDEHVTNFTNQSLQSRTKYTNTSTANDLATVANIIKYLLCVTLAVFLVLRAQAGQQSTMQSFWNSLSAVEVWFFNLIGWVLTFQSGWCCLENCLLCCSRRIVWRVCSMLHQCFLAVFHFL